MDLEYNSLLQDEDNRASMREWITKTFMRRECIQFVQSKTYGEKCGCGRRYEDHRKLHSNSLNNINSQNELHNRKDSKAQYENEQESWKIQTCTETFPTNAFGTIEFQGADMHTGKAEYIRLSFDTKPQNIIKLIKNYWQLELPKLIISVHGGIANFGLQPKLKQAIQRGLIKVANTSHIWIITAGTDTGVVKHIGDILRENFPRARNNVVVFGVAPWGVVNEKESLIGHEVEVPYFSNNPSINSVNSFNLNNCHSYFLLVDDGTVGKYGCEISFRRRFERFLSRHKSEIFMDFDFRPKMFDVTIEEKITLQNHHTIPLVCLVIEGGTNTIQTVLVNVHDNPPVPVVICDGSGRAADLIAFTHKYVHINPITKRPIMDSDVQEQLISTIMKTFAYTKVQADYLFIQLMNCVTNKDLVSIYRLGDEDYQEIDLAILTASLKVIDLQLSKQLDTIMSWNRPDVAKKYIFLTGNESEKHILEEKMFDALSQDKVDFVKLLLEYGVNLQKFLTFKRIQDLYNCKKGPSNTLLLIVKDVIKKISPNHRVTLFDIGLVFEKLMGNGYVSEYSKKEFKSKYSKYLTKPGSVPLKFCNNSIEESNDRDFFKCPYNELLIWAVLMKRHKMAMFVCKRGEETLAKALVAAKLNKALAREAELDDLDSEISEEFKHYAEEFTNLAVGLLDKAYKEDDKLTSQLLTYDLVNWSHWTCLTLAVSANLKDFLSHAACQLLISDLWMGGMKIRKYVTYKVIAALLFPPAIFAIQFKSAKELQYMPQTQEEHEQELEELETNSIDSSQDDSHPVNHLPLNHTDTPEARHNLTDASNMDLLEPDMHVRNHMLSLEQIIEMYDLQNSAPSANDFNAENISEKNNLKVDAQISQEKKTINFFVRKKANKLRFGKKIYEFYNSPITKFWQNTIMYIFFLMCFAYIVLVKTPKRPSPPEIFVLVFIFSYGLDKIRELLQTDSPRFSSKIKIFFSKVMNTLDIFFILTIIVALVFRLSNLKVLQTTARLIYCVNTIYWVIKLMEFLLINKYAGPLIIIASRMLIDLFNFIIILIIILMCFGLSRQAIKFPNEDFRWELVKGMFLEPYFMLYGEVYADTIDPPCDPEKPDAPECQPGHWITPVTMTVFMIVACLLFLSILIASFNNTFVRISRQSALFWKCQRYHFVTAYEAKPLLAPPLVLISLIYMVIKYAIRLCLRKKIKFDRKLKAFLSEEMVQRLHDFEENCVYEYSCDLEQSLKDQMEEKVNHTKNKVESISARIDDIFFKENMTKLSLYKVELRLQKLEEFAYESMEQLNTISNILRNNRSYNSIERTNQLNSSQTNLLNRSSRRRNITISDSCDKSNLNHINSMPNRMSRSPLEVSHFNKSLSNIDNARKRSNNSVDKKSDNNFLTSVHQRRRIFSETNHKDNGNDVSELNSELKNEEIAEKNKDSLDSIINTKYLEDLNKESDSSEEDEPNKIMKKIYQSKTEDQNQAQTGLDQYTLHPFVYLHSVIKPPLAEYTSITDCIDTSNIDRPPSPTLSSSLFNKSNLMTSLNESSNKFINPKLASLKDYCSNDTVRSAVARQESEILRLAEESQHVIISQMLNKIVKSDGSDGLKESNVKNLIKGDRETPVFNLDSDKSPDLPSSPTHNLVTTPKAVTKITFDMGLDESSEAKSSNNFKTTQIIEEDETEKLNSFKLKRKIISNTGKNELNAVQSNQTKPNILPLNLLDRNSSQIFYAQSQANVLCLSNESEREDEINV
ncbi:unnamed protein product [Brachionus calyciflorus]|uniref:Uncharacterized protein n=1 Tax=Brachionus calyciflorus TaxID=104777 RepID=A0A813PQQ8_9BILA|nr:unnamed protein product [Brachionus calyciflorus]